MCFKVFILKKAAYKSERKRRKKVNDCHFFVFWVAMRVMAKRKKIFLCAKMGKFLINFKKPSFKKVCHMPSRANLRRKTVMNSCKSELYGKEERN